VFAGGTSYTMTAFADMAEENRSAKGLDFQSRLKGYIEIPSLDHAGTPRDSMVVIRRAILFRSVLQRACPGLFFGAKGNETVDVDRSVTRAFLDVTSYTHGARSIETILSMSMLDGKRLFEQSSLPSRHLLNVHVDAEEFLKLVRQMPSD
jgi:hypothetical protein